MQMIYIAEISC